MDMLFRLSNDIAKSFSVEDVDDTFYDMHELNIARAPYKKFAIEIQNKFLYQFFKLNHEEVEEMKHAMDVRTENLNLRTLFLYDVGNRDGSSYPEKVYVHRIYENGEHVSLLDVALNYKLSGREDIGNVVDSDLKDISSILYRLLIVLLATKNADKNQIIDKDLARGLYNKSKAYRKDYPITTTITIGKISETHTSGHAGGTVRPHLRRGHIRTQKYGPNYELSKKIFIEPVFVNADEGWIAERRAYNVKAA